VLVVVVVVVVDVVVVVVDVVVVDVVVGAVVVEAVKLLKESAGAFTYLSKSLDVMDSVLTQDLSRVSSEFLSMFMVAQAQGTFFRSSCFQKDECWIGC